MHGGRLGQTERQGVARSKLKYRDCGDNEHEEHEMLVKHYQVKRTKIDEPNRAIVVFIKRFSIQPVGCSTAYLR